MLTNPLEAVIARDALLSPYGTHFCAEKCSLVPHAFSGVVPAAQASCAQPFEDLSGHLVDEICITVSGHVQIGRPPGEQRYAFGFRYCT